jgi:hypothetical protein
MADLFFLAFFSGLLSVPLYALIQSRAQASHRARIIAANNILNALFIIVASLMATALLSAGLTLPQLFLVVGLMNAAVAAYIYLLVPEFLMRFLCWLLVHSVYRLEKRGLENIPEEGAAVLVCNHVSFVDALVIMAASPRPIRFVMYHGFFKPKDSSSVTCGSIAMIEEQACHACPNGPHANNGYSRFVHSAQLLGHFPSRYSL